MSSNTPNTESVARGNSFIVGVGASAGGLQAATELLSHLPPKAPFAIVLVQHLDRAHPSELVELLKRASKLPVNWIEDQTTLEPGAVYVLPQNCEGVVKEGILRLNPRGPNSVASTIDVFLRSLAEDAKHFAVGVQLSGTGSDGVAGLQAIKAAGGLVFAQDEKSAVFPGMPRAAVEAGCVDVILPPAEIAEQLVRLAEDSERVWQELTDKHDQWASKEGQHLATLFRLLSTRRGVDFTGYKQSTVMRRLARRMVLARIEHLGDYVKLLQAHKDEVDALFESLLINVTEFFRDPEYFDFLGTDILPDLISARVADGTPLRIWVAGCSTGEEAYSLAMLVTEQLDAKSVACAVQIFATDVSDRAIGVARAGLYSAAAVEALSAERRARHFVQNAGGYVVTKRLRDLCIFARQNLITDSPFSRLDLISCRNLMIYLGPELQRRILPVFHYALKPEGYLMLGTSESVGTQVDLFRLVDRRFRIYSRKSANRRVNLNFSVDPISQEQPVPKKPAFNLPDEQRLSQEVMKEADRVVLGRHAPPGVLINEDMDILQFRGKVSPYLSPAPGRASLSVTKMAPEGFGQQIEAAVLQAKRENVRVHRGNVRFEVGGEVRSVDLDVSPISFEGTKDHYYLILFIERLPETIPAKPSPGGAEKGGPVNADVVRLKAQVEQLRQDLEATRSYLNATTEKHETTHQELRAANEEIQSSNEELQSTNEELETAKEELQSTNEELTTVNEELHNRQGELLQLNNDLNNLINSVHLPIIILDKNMRIRRFTPMAEKVLNVIPTDVGRPLSDININISVANFPQLVAEVSETLTRQELDVQDRSGRWYSMRLRPYKTSDNKIEGVVVTLIDIDQLKRSRAELEEMRNLAFAAAEAVAEPMVGVNPDLRVRVANDAFYRLFLTASADTLGRSLFDVAGSYLGSPQVREELSKLLNDGKNLHDFPIELGAGPLGRRVLRLNSTTVVKPSLAYPLILITFKVSES